MQSIIQLELWERDVLSPSELAAIVGEMRNLYWHIRNTRRDLNLAKLRRLYRKVAPHKRRLLEAGVTPKQVLDLIACLRAMRCPGRDCLVCKKDSSTLPGATIKRDKSRIFN
jgi:hypothetical protein